MAEEQRLKDKQVNEELEAIHEAYILEKNRSLEAVADLEGRMRNALRQSGAAVAGDSKEATEANRVAIEANRVSIAALLDDEKHKLSGIESAIIDTVKGFQQGFQQLFGGHMDHMNKSASISA